MNFIKIGKNCKDNFDLIDSADPDDLWFHLRDYPSAHGFLGKDFITKENIRLVAEMIKGKSKQKNEKNIVVEYLPVKFVKKTKLTGTVTLEGTPTFIRV
jgi:predicted ribosome quality control (RQC) complex YloA/Tae2 family protein